MSLYGLIEVRNAPIESHYVSDGLRHHLSVNELGRLEGSIANLTEVVVIADNIEEPTNELYNAMKENFKKGVRYVFLISKSKYESELNSYYKLLKGIADAIEHNYNVDNLIDLRPINIEWNDYPYVFYRYNDLRSGESKAFAYMGTQLREGIADEYELINPTISFKILSLALEKVTIPEYEIISKEELSRTESHIIPLIKAV